MKIKTLYAAIALVSSATVFAGDDATKGSKPSDFQGLNSFFSFLSGFKISALPTEQSGFIDCGDDDQDKGDYDDEYYSELPVLTELAGFGVDMLIGTDDLKIFKLSVLPADQRGFGDFDDDDDDWLWELPASAELGVNGFYWS